MQIYSNFEKLVFQEIDRIPFGKTKSYKEIAEAVGKIKSFRAVANACGKNPYPGPIPCHRVIRSDGSLGGYSGAGGVETKRKLLLNERDSFK